MKIGQTDRMLLVNMVNRLSEGVFLWAVRWAVSHPSEALAIACMEAGKAREKEIQRHFDADYTLQKI